MLLLPHLLLLSVYKLPCVSRSVSNVRQVKSVEGKELDVQFLALRSMDSIPTYLLVDLHGI
jgi:hypothetical protein